MDNISPSAQDPMFGHSKLSTREHLSLCSSLIPVHRRRPYIVTPYSATPSLPRAPHLGAPRLSRSQPPLRPFSQRSSDSHLFPAELALSEDFIPVAAAVVAAFPFPLLRFPSARITFHLPPALLLFSPPLGRCIPDHPLCNRLRRLLRHCLPCPNPPPRLFPIELTLFGAFILDCCHRLLDVPTGSAIRCDPPPLCFLPGHGPQVSADHAVYSLAHRPRGL